MTERALYRTQPRTLRALTALAGVGAILFLVGLLVDSHRAWAGYLIGFHYVVGLALAGPLFIAVLALSGARWADAAAPVPRLMAQRLPLAFGLGLILCLGIPSLYEWSHSAQVAQDPLLQHKAPWLNTGGFIVRLLLYFLAWYLATRLLLRRSQGGTRGALLRASALFMLVFAVGYSLASVDWIESLDPHWFSTIFALYILAGLGVSGLACAILIFIGLRRAGSLGPGRHVELLDDLGKIAIGLTLFWAYIWYCQYMLIWYTDMPEETPWYVLRLRGTWQSLTPACLVLNWAIPFLALMLRRLRRSEAAMARIAIVMLIGHGLDLYLLISPTAHPSDPLIGPWELGPILLCLSLFTLALLRGLERRPAELSG